MLINMLKIILNMSPQTPKMNHRNITVTGILKDDNSFKASIILASF